MVFLYFVHFLFVCVILVNCSFGYPYVLFVSCLFVISVVSKFGFEGGTVVLIVPVPCHCFTFLDMLECVRLIFGPIEHILRLI